MAEAKKMEKKEIPISGGRKLIYYTFSKQEKAEEKKQCQN